MVIDDYHNNSPSYVADITDENLKEQVDAFAGTPNTD